jgi:hypothetical protein
VNPMEHVTREQRRELERTNARMPLVLTRVAESQWPDSSAHMSPPAMEVWRSRDFLVQVFRERHNLERLSVSRTALSGDKRWVDGITWDELQRLKRECGRGHLDAVEVFPADRDVVNVANMRHLWVFDQPLDFKWRTL